jgi:hypothetical protein
MHFAPARHAPAVGQQGRPTHWWASVARCDVACADEGKTTTGARGIIGYQGGRSETPDALAKLEARERKVWRAQYANVCRESPGRLGHTRRESRIDEGASRARMCALQGGLGSFLNRNVSLYLNCYDVSLYINCYDFTSISQS